MKRMSEDQIECLIEKAFDRIDRDYMGGKITEAEYEIEVGKINDWAVLRYNELTA